MAEKILIVEDDSRIAGLLNSSSNMKDMKWILRTMDAAGLTKQQVVM